MTRNRQYVLASRPQGEPRAGDFRLVERELPEPAAGQVLLRTLYLSLDPYMRGRMNAGPSYAPPVEIGAVMVGGTVAEVAESRLDGYRPGDVVLAAGGWQEYQLSDGRGLRKLDPAAAPVSTALGVLGMPGRTAYHGLLAIGQPKAGETVAVAAATGAVGSVVGQIARLKGARVVGIAGGPEKCDYLVRELGFDAAVDHRAPDLPGRLAAACPKGIDVYFENVGGAVFAAVLPLLNNFARVPVCGVISQYNAAPDAPDPFGGPALLRTVLSRRITLRGFIVSDFAAQEAAFQADMPGWVRAGRIKYREHVVDGFEAIPTAFLGLFKGENFGKLLVRMKPA